MTLEQLTGGHRLADRTVKHLREECVDFAMAGLPPEDINAIREEVAIELDAVFPAGAAIVRKSDPRTSTLVRQRIFERMSAPSAHEESPPAQQVSVQRIAPGILGADVVAEAKVRQLPETVSVDEVDFPEMTVTTPEPHHKQLARLAAAQLPDGSSREPATGSEAAAGDDTRPAAAGSDAAGKEGEDLKSEI
jgi:hypothetical protein